MTTVESTPGNAGQAKSGDVLAWATAQGRLQHSIASTLLVIAAARAEREAPPIHAARRHLAAVYGATRLRRRLERETVAG
ncbi:hypothetical protein [Methylobacterium haplocladii]|uniref:Uncharacterized protein n=1 Tax=Methylobacterium haplocladii TaxID=1176176 RepID=A0A512IKY9_9HYPH|nr:hypothetical protein [Methylobacterium haplocladii]GEO98376.1 hypothetical protein MHA02_07640 [Methylobacterium haplocladii]GJD83005.1 hypothetical protein HPGCJGGD_0867 [Methylobacterium haplocladii]GLS61496.1 hypothetical protein GCM10007887_42100 [Methylobacterium haplocladii]